MTNELEKQFFDTFGIEQKYEDGTCDMDDKCRYTDCNTCQRINKFNYPQITDRILLGLICINTDEEPNIEWLKKCVLQNLIHRYEKDLFCNTELAKHQVQALFEEKNNDR